MSREKIIGQFKLQLNPVFEPFNLYGLQVFIPEAVKAIANLALQMHEDLKKEETQTGYIPESVGKLPSDEDTEED